MSEKAKRSGVVFRPHFKTHQSHIIGSWFRNFGVDAITVSSAEMAQYFARDGWNDITIAFPANLLETKSYNELASAVSLNLILDDEEVALRLGKEMQHPAGVFIEIDCGYPRTGIHFSDTKGISRIIRALDDSLHLHFRGFRTHAGNIYTAGSREDIIKIYRESIFRLQELKESFSANGRELLISVGDTPACSLVEDLAGVDEIRPGNFVYYDLMQYDLGSCSFDDIAVSVACPVAGIYPERNEIVIYGGAIHLSKDFIFFEGEKVYGKVVLYDGNSWSAPLPETSVVALSQEHGIIRTLSGIISKLRHGDLLGIIPVHSCLTANLLRDNILIINT